MEAVSDLSLEDVNILITLLLVLLIINVTIILIHLSTEDGHDGSEGDVGDQGQGPTALRRDLPEMENNEEKSKKDGGNSDRS